MELKEQNKKRSLDELRRDINSKAEVMFKDSLGDKVSVIFLIALFALFEAMNYMFGWFWNHLLICGAFVVFLALTIIKNIVVGHQLRRMTGADTGRQHQQEAKRFVKIYQLANLMGFPLAYLFVTTVLNCCIESKTIIATLLIVVLFLLWLCFRHDAFIDSNLYNDIEELNEYKFEE